MNDSELRALVRDAVARHLGKGHLGGHGGHEENSVGSTVSSPGVLAAHPSHVMYLTLVNEGDACLIEPAVPCNHCGYCRSHGH